MAKDVEITHRVQQMIATSTRVKVAPHVGRVKRKPAEDQG